MTEKDPNQNSNKRTDEEIWKEYAEKTKDIEPRKLLLEALSYVTEKENALDLGSGALNDAQHLLSEGFQHVIAVDKIPVATEIAEKLDIHSFQYVAASMEDFDYPKNHFNLISAQYSLPFVPPSEITNVFGKIHTSLKADGIFTGQLFGDRDEWVNDASMNFQTKDEALAMLSQYEIVSFAEEEHDSATAGGKMKHWHVFHFIVKK